MNSAICRVVFVLSLLVLASCGDNRTFHGVPIAAVFSDGQPVQLRRMSTMSGSEFHGFFFLGSGTINGKMSTRVYFSWAIAPNEYVISSIPIEHVRVVIDEKNQSPLVVFTLRPAVNADGCATGRRVSDDLQQAVDEQIEYVTIRCKETDWSMKVTLPLNQ